MSDNKPKLVLIYAFAGVGKSTLAKRLNKDIPMSLYLEEDELLTMIGQWLENEEKARGDVYLMMKSLVVTYLGIGQDVIIPYLLTDESRAREFEEISRSCGADFLEIYIRLEKKEAVGYLLERGTWGEKGAPKINKSDVPHINNIYDNMVKAMSMRKNCVEIPYTRGDVEKTYLGLKKVVNI